MVFLKGTLIKKVKCTLYFIIGQHKYSKSRLMIDGNKTSIKHFYKYLFDYQHKYKNKIIF